MLKVYLDNCCYGRPFDDLSIGNNRNESSAKLFIQSLVKYNSIELYYSFVTLGELNDNPFEDIKANILDFIEAHATAFIGIRKLDELRITANEIMSTGVKPKDAAHLACAITTGCDYFISTDTRLLKYKTDKIILLNPIEFVDMWRTK